MVAIDDDDSLSDDERALFDMTEHGVEIMIDLSSAIQVERANRLLQRGLIRNVGLHRGEETSGVWTLVKRVEAGDAQPDFTPLTPTAPPAPAPR